MTLTGDYTTNSYFYKPDLGASGAEEKAAFDGALDSTDAYLAGLTIGGGSSYPILGVTTGYATLGDALTTIGSTATTLCIPSAAGSVAVTDDTTIPANVHLRIEKGAYFTISTTKTLTINGTLEAGPYKIFAWAGTGKVSFNTGKVPDAYIRWWGTVGDGSTDDTAAVQAAFDAVSANASSMPMTLHGSSGDRYAVDTIKYHVTSAPWGGSMPVRSIIGHGAAFQQTGVNDLIQLDTILTRLNFEEWSLFGSVNNVYVIDLVSEPTAVTFDGTTGTKVGSLQAVNGARKWFWAASKLYIYCVVTGSNLSVCPPGLLPYYTSIKADGGADLTAWTRYYGGTGLHVGNVGAEINGVSLCNINNIEILYFDKAIKLAYGLSNKFSNIEIQSCNYGIYSASSYGGSNHNTFDHFNIGLIFEGAAIHIQDGCSSYHFSNFALELIFGRLMYLYQAEGFTFDSFYTENVSIAGTVSEAIYFYDCRGINFTGCQFQGSAATHTMSRYVRFDTTCYGISFISNHFILGNSSTTYIHVQSATADCGGISFKDNSFRGCYARWTGEYAPVGITCDNNGFSLPSWILTPVSTLRTYPKTYWSPEHSNWNPSFADTTFDQTAKTQSNATHGSDNTQGYDDKYSWKITWTGASGYAQLLNLFGCPQVAGTYYSVIGFFVKSDTQQYITVDHWSGGATWSHIPLGGDNKWRYLQLISPVGKVAQATGSNITGLRITADTASSGNIWIDRVSQMWHPSLNDACAALGKLPPSYTYGANIVLHPVFGDGGADWTKGTGWTYSGDMSHTGTDTTTLSQTTCAATVGTIYDVYFNTYSASAGTLQCTFGGVSLAPTTGNGFHVQRIQAVTTDYLVFTPTTDWNGTLYQIYIKPVTGIVD